MDHAKVGDLAAQQHGVVTFDQLVESGMEAHHAKHFIEEGFLERLHVGVFKVRGAPSSYKQQLVAGCLAIGPDAAASHRAAATLHGLLSYRDPAVEVTTTRQHSPELAGVVVHRLADLRERWVTSVDGVRVTTVARTLVDLGAVAAPRTVEVALDRAAGRRLVTYREVRDAMIAVARQGRRGVGTIRPLLVARIGEVVPAGVFEARMATLLRNAGLPPAEPEFVVVDEHGGFVAVVDFAYPDRQIAIEVDGYEFHSSPKAIADRNTRDRLLAAVEWVPLHFSWSEVESRSHRVATEIRHQLRLRSGFSAR